MMPKHAVSAVVYLNPIDNLSENVFIDVPCSFAVSRTCSSSRQAFDEVREDFRSVTDVVDSRNARGARLPRRPILPVDSDPLLRMSLLSYYLDRIPVECNCRTNVRSQLMTALEIILP